MFPVHQFVGSPRSEPKRQVAFFAEYGDWEVHFWDIPEDSGDNHQMRESRLVPVFGDLIFGSWFDVVEISWTESAFGELLKIVDAHIFSFHTYSIIINYNLILIFIDMDRQITNYYLVAIK